MTGTHTKPAVVVYHISPWRTWPPTVALAGLSFLMLNAAVNSPEWEARAFVLTALFMFALTGLFYWAVRFTRLELSAEGVRLRQIGYTLETGWDNVASLYDVRGAEGIVLHRPMPSRGASVLRGFRNFGTGAGVNLYNAEQARLLAERRFIPIDSFAYWLKHGTLREQLAGSGSHFAET